MHHLTKRFTTLIIIIAVPIVLTMTVVRLLTLPWYPAWLYARPGFPVDPYGFSPSERLRLATATIRFLNIPGQTDILETLTLVDGTPAYNARELHHMDDVKAVYDGLTLAAGISLVAGVAAAVALRRLGEGPPALWAALIRGGTLTLSLLGALGVWMLIGFNRFFTAFHNVFFEPGTWIFYTTDTLIRLFPIELWQTAGLLIAGSVALLSLVLIVIGRRQRSRRPVGTSPAPGSGV